MTIDMALATSYQRIPAATLAAVKPLTPLNFAVLSGDVHTYNRDVRAAKERSACPYTKRAARLGARWETKSFPRGVTLQNALLQVEAVNAATPVLHKVQMNFTNGAHLAYERKTPTDPATLAAVTLYDPSNTFRATAAPRVAQRRAEKKMDFLVDERGRALKPNPNRLSSFDPRSLYRHTPDPGRASPAGYAFTPLSTISFQVRPSSAVPGCRNPIGATNPHAAEYRPRVLSRAATPNFFEPVDERNRATPALKGSVGRVRPRTATPAGR